LWQQNRWVVNSIMFDHELRVCPPEKMDLAGMINQAEVPLRTLKPPLKWAGGKRWIVKHVEPLWQKSGSKKLIEPLCGGLAVALGLLPRCAHLNDLNTHLINFYRWLKKGLVIQLKMENDQDLYYAYRERFNQLIDSGASESSEAASLFYYLNRTGYNGLCRFNKKGLFNVPFGRYKLINYRHDFTDYRDLLISWEFSALDFEKLEPAAADFTYADPPYDVQFTSYTALGFSWEDQIRFARWLAQLKGPVVVSNQATARIVELYEELGFNLRLLEGPRMISCTGNRTPAGEILATLNI
jgi:DNA adenine methylase